MVYNEWPAVLNPRILIPRILSLSSLPLEQWHPALGVLLPVVALRFDCLFLFVCSLFYFILPGHLETKLICRLNNISHFTAAWIAFGWSVPPTPNSHTSGGKKGLPREFLGVLL